ncbi:MAG TPA: hypothetical protein V6D14_30045 [Coleofasciculaceae cyanobacterium]|jgi:hypothetical protein
MINEPEQELLNKHILLNYLVSKMQAGTLTDQEEAVLGAVRNLLNSQQAEDFWTVMEFTNDCFKATIKSVESLNNQNQSAMIRASFSQSRREELKRELGFDKIQYRGMPLTYLVDLPKSELRQLSEKFVINLFDLMKIEKEKARLEAMLKSETNSDSWFTKVRKFVRGE